MRLRTSILCLLMLLGAAGARAQEIEIGIVKQAFERYDILVMPLEVTSGGTEAQQDAWTVESVMSLDLDYSGLFRALSPQEADTAAVSFGIEGVLEGRLPGTAVTAAEAAPVLTLRLVSQPGRQVLLNKRYRPTAGQLRASAHHFVNEVVQLIMGEPGIALTRIVFSRGSDDRRDIYCVDYDGEGLKRLTANRRLNLFPAWSPDGTQIAFMSWEEGQQGLYLLETATGDVSVVNRTLGSNLGPTWSPDGKELLASLSKTGQHEIYRIRLKDGHLQRLTVSDAIEVSPSWSPNGRDIVFTSDRTGSPQLYVMGGDGSGRRRLSFEGRYNDAASWSPNGELIVYACREQDITQVVLMNQDGSERRFLTDASWGNCEDPAWAPDSRHVVFASDRSGLFKLYVMDVTDGSARQLTFGDEPDTTPHWSR
ncbi:MAG TPA: hypothetical protein P5571_03880 [Candidatus Krumholzibacteria bacterium]|nr:hypothetical protein [Candidatus Krumholzibacteria bacterium]